MADDIFSTPSTQGTPVTPTSPPPTPQAVGVTVPQQVQDIFGDTENSSVPSHMPDAAVHTESYSPYVASTGGGISRKTIILIAGAVIAILMIIGAVFLMVKTVKTPAPAATVQTPVTEPTPATPTPTQEPTPTSTTPEPTSVTPEQAEQPATQPPSDADGDGLTDAEETMTYHTSLDLPDTDNDALTDREEVNVYKTDPLNADTDADGFLDGQEIHNGYNPNGAGKLPIVP